VYEGEAPFTKFNLTILFYMIRAWSQRLVECGSLLERMGLEWQMVPDPWLRLFSTVFIEEPFSSLIFAKWLIS